MAISEAAQRNHDELFPGHVSTLSDTDPELIEYFDNFAFGEVSSHGSLDTRTRLIVQLAALIACQALREYRVMLGAALTVGVTPVEIKEIVYQAVPYVGMGKVFDFLHATNDILTERGIDLPLPDQSTTTPDTRMEQGRAVQSEIVGPDAVDAMYAGAPPDLLHIQRYLSGNCFGDHLTRAGLDLATRELVTLSLLASLGGCDAQVRGHVRGNLNVGNDRARLIDVVTQLLPFIGYPRTLNAINAINEITPARTTTPRGDPVNLQPKTASTKGPAEMFSGDVWFDVIAAGELPSRLRVNLVRFAPGAHTAWHRHANGQTLHVTDGVGLVQSRGGELTVMKPGDTVYTPPGEWHWHGAAPDHFMAHLAMWESLSEDQEGPETEWGDHLTDSEYSGHDNS